MLPILLAAFIAASSSPAAANEQTLQSIPDKFYEVAQQTVQSRKISSLQPIRIEATAKQAIISTGRQLFSMSPGDQHLRLNTPKGLPPAVDFFSGACSFGDSVVVAVSSYPKDRAEQEAATGRGGFIAGPSDKGYLLLEADKQAMYIPSLTITARPPMAKDDAALIGLPLSNAYRETPQSCFWDGTRLFMGAYASFGLADFKRKRIAILREELTGIAWNYTALLVEPGGQWIALDEGGAGGAKIQYRSRKSSAKSYHILNQRDPFDVVSYNAIVRYRQRLFVGTSHGLFELNEKTGRFTRIVLNKDSAHKAVELLRSAEGKLWAMQGGQWYVLTTTTQAASLIRFAEPAHLEVGVPFDGGWLVGGPGGLWRVTRVGALD